MTERERWLKVAWDWDKAAHGNLDFVQRRAWNDYGLCDSIGSFPRRMKKRLTAWLRPTADPFAYWWPENVNGAGCRAIAAALMAELVDEPLP